jgi:vitamin B12 transporter
MRARSALLSTTILTTRRDRFAGLALTALAALAATPLHAQPIELPPLTVFSSSLTPIEASKVGSSVSVMTGEEMRSSGFNQLSDAMRTFPGMHVSQSGTRGTLTQFRVRGTEANHLLVMIDGVPVNAVGDGEFNFANIPIDDIERVELLRGPQSGLYGANAHSGVLTIITKSGRGLTKPEFNARFEGGTQKSANAAMSARGALGPVYAAVTATYGTTDGFNIARDGSEIDGARRFAFTAKGGIDVSPNLNVEGFLRLFNRSAATDPQNEFPNFTGLTFDRAGDLARYNDALGRVEATLKLFDDRWIQSVKWTTAQQHVTAFGPTSMHPLGQTSAIDGANETLSYKSSVLVGSNVLGGENHRLTGFVEQRRERFSFEADFLFGPDLEAARANKTRRSTGIGGEHVLDLLATGTTISSAVRQDFNEPFKDELTWRFTLSQKVAPVGGRLHASIARGVTNPSFIEQFGFIKTGFLPNPNLIPESSIGWDAGWEQTLWNGRAVIDVTYFNSRLEHEIVTVFLPGFISTVRNLDGTSTRQGVEVTAKVRPTDWLTLAGSYTYTDSRDDLDIQEIRRPRHAASGSATVLFADGRGKATAQVVYNGKMTDTWFKFPTETVTLAAYTLIAGQISFDVKPWATVYLRGENIFDARYEEVFSYRSPGAAVYAGLKFRTPE